MISFLSILLWNSEHPRYPGILFSDRIYPAYICAGPRQRDLRHSYGGQVRFTTTPFMTGFPLRSNTQVYMDCQAVFPAFLFGQVHKDRSGWPFELLKPFNWIVKWSAKP